MILSAHQPVFLPWCGLLHKIAVADTFVSFDNVQYMPKEWQNRNRVKTAQGAQWLTVPVLRKGHREKPLRLIEINNQAPWKRKHWRALELAYAKAPFWDMYAPGLADLYRRDWQYLSDLNERVLQWLLTCYGINTRLLRASDYTFYGAKSMLVLDMCRKLRADRYVFGALGRDYADVDAFEAAGVEAVFQDYRHPVYPQQHGAFVSHLSAADLLFNCGPDSQRVLLEGQAPL